jgi:ubiquinone/menaquinone biosynthesis C-methylase UbiE
MFHSHAGRQTDHHRGGDQLIRWAGLYDLGMRLWGAGGRRWRALVADQLDLSPGQRVLDVASGTGHLSLELARRVRPGGSVDGIDAAAEMTARAQATARGLGLPVTFQTAAAQRLPFPDGAFDAAICTLGLHHIAPADRQQAVNEMQRVLRSGGRLLIADAQPPTTGVRSLLPRLLLGHAIAERPLDQAERLLHAAGFLEVTRSDTTVSWIGVVIGTAPTSSITASAD